MNNEIEVKLYKRTINTASPQYAHVFDSGMDVCCDFDSTYMNFEKGVGFMWNVDVNKRSVIIHPRGNALIGTGLKVAIPQGYEIQVRSKSGMALKGVQASNSPGTIDAGYRGDVGVILHNFGHTSYIIKPGDKVAQIVLCKVERMSFREVSSAEELEDTTRGDGGFGSTGI